MRKAWLFACAISFAPAAHAQDLSFSDAIDRAASDGPTIGARNAAVDAARHSIRPAGALPDPELVLALYNVPVTGVDRYRLNRDEMTMQRVGIMQQMPSGLHARRAVAEAEAERAGASLDVARLQARLGAAQAWIALYYADRRVELLDRLATEARASAQAARSRLAGGVASVDEAIAAEVEVARLEDRVADLQATFAAARAELRRWIGDAADEELADEAPTFAVDPDHLRHHLRNHPELAIYQAEADVAAANVDLARTARLPDWSWEVSYGRRDPSFGDMASVEVRVGLPLFQSGRQSQTIDARRSDAARVDAERAAAEREHASMLEAQLAEYAAVTSNLARAQDVRLSLAERRASAVQGGFASGAGSTAQLIDARRGVLETQLEIVDLSERRARLGAALTLQYAELTP
jgi:cobalt-zinc-cadmium efflux system outer membrane protein